MQSVNLSRIPSFSHMHRLHLCMCVCSCWRFGEGGLRNLLSIAIQVMGLIGLDETNYHNLRLRRYLPSSSAIEKMETSFRVQTLIRGQSDEGLFRDTVETYRVERTTAVTTPHPEDCKPFSAFILERQSCHLWHHFTRFQGEWRLEEASSTEGSWALGRQTHRCKTIISEKDFLEHLAKHSSPNHCFPLKPPLAARPSETEGSCRPTAGGIEGSPRESSLQRLQHFMINTPPHLSLYFHFHLEACELQVPHAVFKQIKEADEASSRWSTLTRLAYKFPTQHVWAVSYWHQSLQERAEGKTDVQISISSKFRIDWCS